VPEPAQPADASHPPAEFNPLRHPILFDTPQLLSIDSTWVGHVPLAYLMIDLLRPRVLVELGTHHGDSYCAFCQAVAALESPTRCVAVDTWAGDEQTGPYDERIFAALKAHHDPLYGSFSTLMRAEFDEALAEFEDGSIDLLHFDGPPTYEAAKHAYDTWLPKMSERGVMLFHDVEAPELRAHPRARAGHRCGRTERAGGGAGLPRLRKRQRRCRAAVFCGDGGAHGGSAGAAAHHALAGGAVEGAVALAANDAAAGASAL
jgi:hypothetical protein